MEADSFSLKLALSVLAKEDKASCPSWMNLSSTPMYLFCRAMLSRLASASCRAFSFVSFSLRASTRLHASVIYTSVSTFPEVRGINLNLGRNLSYELLRILDTKSIHPRKFADSIYYMPVSRSCKAKQNDLNQEVKSEKMGKHTNFKQP